MKLFDIIYLSIIIVLMVVGMKYLFMTFYTQKVGYGSLRYKIIAKYCYFTILFSNYKVLNMIVARWFVGKQFLFNNHIEWTILKKVIDTDRERCIISIDKSFKETLTDDDKQKLKEYINKLYEHKIWKNKFDKEYFRFIKKNPDLPVKL